MAPKPRERKRKRFFFMPGDRDGRRRKPGRERNGDLNTAALFPFAAKTPAGKRNRKRCPGLFASESLDGEKRREKAAPKGTAFRLTIFSAYDIMTASNKGKPLEGG